MWSTPDFETNTWEHNHIEDGHSQMRIPEANFPNQLSDWKNRKWRKVHAHLDENGSVIYGVMS
jgi:hypothetical protein